MRKIALHGPTVDRHGMFRDAGETLTVGAEDNDKTDVTTAHADELLERGVAVTLAEDREAEAAAEEIDPLDHDGDGQRGGSLAGAASTRAIGAAKAKAGA